MRRVDLRVRLSSESPAGWGQIQPRALQGLQSCMGAEGGGGGLPEGLQQEGGARQAWRMAATGKQCRAGEKAVVPDPTDPTLPQ